MSKSFEVNITDLTFDTIIGILPFERETPQRVIVNVSFSYEFNPESKEFVDYSKVSKAIENTMVEQKFLLIEDAILLLEKLLCKNYPIENLKLTIVKPDILDNCQVSVSN